MEYTSQSPKKQAVFFYFRLRLLSGHFQMRIPIAAPAAKHTKKAKTIKIDSSLLGSCSGVGKATYFSLRPRGDGDFNINIILNEV